MRTPETGVNLIAYSRMARILQAVRNRNDKSFDAEDVSQICLPLSVINTPIMRQYLSPFRRMQKFVDYSLNSNENNADESEQLPTVAEKRSLATLAKNGDLPGNRRQDGSNEQKKVVQR